MKRTILLTAAFSMLTTLGFAQSGALQKMVPSKKATLTEAVRADRGTAARPHRSVANGVYYTHERGVMYTGYTYDGLAYRGTFLNYPPFYDVVLYNQSGSNDVQWSIGENDVTSWMNPETGDFEWGAMPKTTASEEGLRSYTIPTMTKGAISYSFLETDARGSANEDGTSMVVTNYSGWDLSYVFNDYNTNILYGGGSIDPGTGTEDDTYIYGTGRITFRDGTTWNSVGVAQVFPAPVSPFIAREISIRTVSNTVPIAEGKQLYMDVRDVEQLSNGELTWGDNVYETLVATADDIDLAWTYSDGTKVFNVKFHKKEIDDFGIEADAPFVLDKDFSLLIAGVTAEGIDCGFMGITIADEDADDLVSADPIIELDGQYSGFSYGIPLALPADFWGFFDAVEIPTILYGSDEEGNTIPYENCNILRISADGQTVTNEKYPEEFDAYVYASVARDWVDEDGNENYYLDAPDWITNYTVVPTSSVDESGLYVLTVTGEPLPEGVTGRTGYVYLKGMGGLTSESPIIVLQGDASVDEALSISPVAAAAHSTNNQVYNLAGQKVNGNYKGIVVKDGKKMIRK